MYAVEVPLPSHQLIDRLLYSCTQYEQFCSGRNIVCKYILARDLLVCQHESVRYEEVIWSGLSIC